MKNLYTSPGCSQEDHIPGCGHFGHAGTYLSPHTSDCIKLTERGGHRIRPCICNPKARFKIRIIRRKVWQEPRMTLFLAWYCNDLVGVFTSRVAAEKSLKEVNMFSKLFTEIQEVQSDKVWH